MARYQTRDEQQRSMRALIKPLLITGAILIVIVLGVLWLVDFILGQQITIERDQFTELAIRQMEAEYHFDPGDALIPLYTFEQGTEESREQYEGIVLKMNADIAEVLTDCFGLNPDGEVYLNIYNNYQDYFVDKAYHGYTETVYTAQGKAKAIRFTLKDSAYIYYFYEEDQVPYLMARKLD